MDDTHAVREAESRLGAACTLAFVCFSLMLLYDGYYQDNELVSSSLVFSTADEMETRVGVSHSSYGELRLRIDLLSDSHDCRTIGEETEISPALNCTLLPETRKCLLEWTCKVGYGLSSNADAMLTLPKTIQGIAWDIKVKSWEFQKLGEEKFDHLVRTTFKVEILKTVGSNFHI